VTTQSRSISMNDGFALTIGDPASAQNWLLLV
jgi:hypothetical protein